MLSKQEALLGRAAGAEGRRVREMERTALPRASQSQVLWSLGSFPVCPGLANHSELASFLGAHTSLSGDGFQQGGSWEGGRTSGLEFPVSF